jgi:ArsR family metal-binding transcriptional regulator
MSDASGSQRGCSPELISGYELELYSPPCVPGADTWSARISLAADIEQVFPYLNARLQKADYDRDAKVLIWKHEGRSYAFRPREIKAGPARDREEARRLIERAVALVNEAWAERGSIEPRYSRRRVPNLTQVYLLLPRSNCGKCGFATCMAFAAALREGKSELSRCPLLGEPSYCGNRGGLLELLGASGG